MTYERANKVKHLAPDAIKVLEGLEWVEYLKEQKGGILHHYFWQPQVGEWIISPSKMVRLIISIDINGFYYAIRNGSGFCDKDNYRDIAPILDWQEIEGVLEKAGYKVLIGHRIEGKYFCWILGNKTADAWGKTRQEAVMKATIKLRKEAQHERRSNLVQEQRKESYKD